MKSINEQYKAVLEQLYTQLPMYQRKGPVAMKKDLGNIIELSEHLGNPHQQFQSIHIAGTNGKGTVAHMLAAILQQHGLKVGLYTSPHYHDFRERIKLNGKLIPKKEVIAFVNKHGKLFNKIKPSFFEISVALAFDFFANKKVDIAIVETGLGGRLDSTNILKPLLSVITNISFDHQEMLGDTLELIAQEKAGIIKKKVPVIVGETNPESKKVFKKVAKKNKAELIFAQKVFKIKEKTSNYTFSTFKVQENKEKWKRSLRANVHGPFQNKNLATALTAVRTLQTVWSHGSIEEDTIRTALKEIKQLTQYKGRWHLLSQFPTILCDSAHNEAGLKSVFKAVLKERFTKLHVVFGVVKDKNLKNILPLLPKNAIYYFAKADIPRGLKATELQASAEKYDLKGKAYSSVPNALKAAKRNAKRQDFIFIGGSIFVVAEVIR